MEKIEFLGARFEIRVVLGQDAQGNPAMLIEGVHIEGSMAQTLHPTDSVNLLLQASQEYIKMAAPVQRMSKLVVPAGPVPNLKLAN